MTLDQLPVSSCALIKEIRESSLAPKLMEMGLYPGKKLTMLFRAPLGDPLAIDVDGYTLSLRKDEASLIELLVK